MGTQKSRREKVNWFIEILTAVKRKGIKAANKKELLAMFANELGSTSRTGNEILYMLSVTGAVTIKENEVWLN